MPTKQAASPFLLCVNNEHYPASLEVRKVYRMIPDPRAPARNVARVIDESGEDYLDPQDCFVPVRLPQAATRIFPTGHVSR